MEYMKQLLQPWNYVNGSALEALHGELKALYGGDIFLTQNGRGAEYLLLKALGIGAGDNVVVQSFTCNAVVNPIKWVGAEVRYVDIDRASYSPTLEQIQKVVDENTKVIIVQHSFGVVGEIEEIVSYAKDKGIFVLEDSAHSLGVKSNGQMLGTFGDAAIVSFGIDKVLPTIVGGALVVNNPDIVEKIDAEYQSWKVMNGWNTFKWLSQPIFWKISSLFGVKQAPVARFLDSVGLISLGFETCELEGIAPKGFPRRMSNGIASIALSAYGNLHMNLSHRESIVTEYLKVLPSEFKSKPILWYPYLAKDEDTAQRLQRELTLSGFRAVDWYRPPVYPSKEHLKDMNYEVGKYPMAEDLSERVVGLPTGMNIKIGDVSRIVEIVKSID